MSEWNDLRTTFAMQGECKLDARKLEWLTDEFLSCFGTHVSHRHLMFFIDVWHVQNLIGILLKLIWFTFVTRILSGPYSNRSLSLAIEIRQCIKISEMVLPKHSLHMFRFLLRGKFFMIVSVDPSTQI
jgi:hypothetical protein